MSESPGPSSTDLMNAVVVFHDFTERGLGSLSAKIDRIDAKFEGRLDCLQIDINRRFDRVDDRFDRVETRVQRLETNVHEFRQEFERRMTTLEQRR